MVAKIWQRLDEAPLYLAERKENLPYRQGFHPAPNLSEFKVYSAPNLHMEKA